MGRGPKWKLEELQLIRDNPDIPYTVLAEKLGRTVSAVRNVRSRENKRLDRPAQEYNGTRRSDGEFDTRPSGWYEESVGQMLFDYKPAWEAWKHYHRYTEIELVSFRDSVLGGILHLRCRRDADAP